MQAEQHQAELDKARIGPQCSDQFAWALEFLTCTLKCPKAKKDQEAAAKQQAEEHEKEHLACITCRTFWIKTRKT